MDWKIAHFDDLSTRELYAVLRLRQEIFVVEQNCVYLDADGMDQNAVHILCWQQGELMAYLRALAPGASYPQSSVGRIVVSPLARGLKLGRELVERGIAYNLDAWPESDIRIGAQAYLQAFYTGLGFVVEGDSYIEDGIEHIHMNLARTQAEK
jgi:ElaA protein